MNNTTKTVVDYQRSMCYNTFRKTKGMVIHMQNQITEYEKYELLSRSLYNRRCIDGKVSGCGNCVGYCKYKEHPGFLTDKLRESHNCIGKECDYYVARERTKVQKAKKNKRSDSILQLVKKYVAAIDDIRIMNSRYDKGRCIIDYVSVFGDFNLSDIEKSLSDNTGYPVKMNRLNYSFDICVELISQ